MHGYTQPIYSVCSISCPQTAGADVELVDYYTGELILYIYSIKIV